jgi:hypothetical protein
MRLHDIQIILSSSDITSKYQQVYQHQASVMQSQNAISMLSQANQKLTQTQQMVQGRETKPIVDNENRFREWKKEHFNEEQKNKSIKKKDKKKDYFVMKNFEHVIDIKA